MKNIFLRFPHYQQGYYDYYIMYIIYIIITILSITCALPLSSYGQTKDIQISNEYLLQGKKEKAVVAYKKLTRKKENIPFIHTNYLNLLLELKHYKEAEKYVQKLIKDTNELHYKADLVLIYNQSGQEEKEMTYVTQLIQSNVNIIVNIIDLSKCFKNRHLYQHSISTLIQSREKLRSPLLYTFDLASLYQIQGEYRKMTEEYIDYIVFTNQDQQSIENILRFFITGSEALDHLHDVLMMKIQMNPSSKILSSLIIYVNLQKKNFHQALLQAKSYDLKFSQETDYKTMHVGQVALTNEDYDVAKNAFEFIIQKFSKITTLYQSAWLSLLKIQDNLIRLSISASPDSVKNLIEEYTLFIDTYKDQSISYRATIAKAKLYADFLDQPDTAIYMLRSLVQHRSLDHELLAEAKIQLADLYLVIEQPWESTLLLSQVEKEESESALGYEAKLRNAKLSYYKGDFKLALEHLKILKEATTRKIANDALDLSLFIQENLAFDSSGTELKKFISAEILENRNKFEECLDYLQNWTSQVKERNSTKSPILSHVYWKTAHMHIKVRSYDQAVASLTQLITEFENSVLIDDALFLKATLYELHLQNKNEAMIQYKNVFEKFPNSIYASKARKRYRTLRGDFDKIKF